MAGRLGCEPGGIHGLVGLTDEHPDAVAYDWRTRFGQSASVIGTDLMGWDEAVSLVRTLRADPSSAVAASIEGWSHPISREALILMDLFDLDHAVNSKKMPEPHGGRPWKQDGSKRERRGNAAGRTPAQVVAILRQFGHGENAA